MWLRYVDDTFVIWPHGRDKLQDFLSLLNEHHPSISFSFEIEANNTLPFLDVAVSRNSNGTLGHKVYRKPTHTDRYLNYRSFHHPSVKQSVSKSLVRRAHQICDETSLPQELQHVKNALINNGFPPH